MKVIIQNLTTRRHLSADGRWVRAAEDAKDFYSLIPAYHFARQNTEGRFTVVLYCPDDNYCTNIIEGEGEGVATSGTAALDSSAKMKITVVCDPKPTVTFVSLTPTNFTATHAWQSRLGDVCLN